MDTGHVVIAVGAAVACVGAYWLLWREDFEGTRSGWHYRRELRRRLPLSVEQFHGLYYGASGIPLMLVERFRQFMGKCWGVDPARLLPEDDLVRMYDVDAAEIVADIEDEFGVRIATSELGNLDTSFDGLLRRIQMGTAARPHSPRSGKSCVPTQSVGTRM
jgi:hypothetical protein